MGTAWVVGAELARALVSKVKRLYPVWHVRVFGSSAISLKTTLIRISPWERWITR